MNHHRNSTNFSLVRSKIKKKLRFICGDRDDLFNMQKGKLGFLCLSRVFHWHVHRRGFSSHHLLNTTNLRTNEGRKPEKKRNPKTKSMAASQEGKSDAQLLQLLSHLLQEVELLTNQEVELRAKIEAFVLEVTKVPKQPAGTMDELEIAKELDKLSSKLDDVDEMITSAIAEDPQVQTLLSSTADVWMPVITATSEERRRFTASIEDSSKLQTPREDH